MAWTSLNKITTTRVRVWDYINKIIDNLQYLYDGGGGSGDMTKAVYDIDDNGIVDAAASLDDGTTGGSISAADVISAVEKVDDQAELQKASIKVVSSANYTILDADGYTEIHVTTGASDRTINLPTLADNQNRKILIRKIDSGAGKVIVVPEGSEYINDWSADVEITEQYGWWEFTAISSRWVTRTDGWSTIYQVSSTAIDGTLTTTSGNYDDVAGMSLALTCRGKFILSFSASLYFTCSGADVYGIIGVGKTSGNNAPDIYGEKNSGISFSSGTVTVLRSAWNISGIEIEIAANQTLYLKSLAYGSSLSYHQVRGFTNTPMCVQIRRIR